jgi:hypothetical protein
MINGGTKQAPRTIRNRDAIGCTVSSLVMEVAIVHAVIPSRDVEITWQTAPNAVTRRVLESVYFCARPPIEKRNNEWE